MDLVGAAVAVFDRFALWAEQKIIAGLDSAYGGHPMYVVDGIPYRNRLVGRDLAPFFAERLRAFFADPVIRGNVWVHSGSRSKAHQAALYAAYRAGVGNLAANPNGVQGWVTWTDPQWVARGSWHMVQTGGPDEFVGAGAVDLSTTLAWGHVHAVADEHGIRFPVAGEPWHAQSYTTAGIYPTTDPDPEPPTPSGDQEDDMRVIHNTDTGKVYFAVLKGGSWDGTLIGQSMADDLVGQGIEQVSLPKHLVMHAIGRDD